MHDLATMILRDARAAGRACAEAAKARQFEEMNRIIKAQRHALPTRHPLSERAAIEFVRGYADEYGGRAWYGYPAVLEALGHSPSVRSL